MNNTYHRACVTGGAGFIGSRLVRRLLESGMDVCVLDNLSVGRAEHLPAAARLVRGDLLDGAACHDALAGCDILFHLAARVAIRSSFDFVVEDTMTNVAGTASILRAAWKIGSVRKVIAASSMGVYSDSASPDPVAESHPTEPASPYGISKLALEKLTHNMASTAGFESVVLRLFNTYGPGQSLSPYVGVVTIFVNKLRSGAQPTIFGDGQQARDFVHVDDVVSGFLAAMRAKVPGSTFNIGTGRARTILDVYRAVAKAMDSDIQPVFSEAAAGELRYSVADIGNAAKHLGYKPARTFDSAIAEVVGEILRGH